MRPAGSGRTVYAAIAALVVVLDQVTKVLVDRFMSLHESRIVVDGFLRLTYVRNRGAAFGILSDADLPYQPLLFAVVSLAALGGHRRLRVAPARAEPAAPDGPRPHHGRRPGEPLGPGPPRHVIDFVDAYWRSHHWPAFNVADSAISVGVVLLVLDILRQPQAAESPQPLRPEPGAETPERVAGEAGAREVATSSAGRSE